MKRLFAISFLLFFIALNGSPAALAAPDTAPANGQSAIDKRVDIIFPPGSVQDKDNNQGALPTGDLKKDIVPAAIKIALALAGTLFFCAIVYSGVMLVIAQGNEEELTKFKNMLIWSLVGLAFITASYALVRGVMNLVFK